ncbi:Ankyrin-1 [Symbiodinium microadriaticum]|uniref:Ankyrin-1 n=1 Tax=Symbiodinium microadriaticum TaxID=2951 RepID=A0A1Q9CQS8_SYMMI|nr:Ankyrin-1 [Symbiodinium microadriaticum]
MLSSLARADAMAEGSQMTSAEGVCKPSRIEPRQQELKKGQNHRPRWGTSYDCQGPIAASQSQATCQVYWSSSSSVEASEQLVRDRLVGRIPTLDDLQAAWRFLQSCAAPRANYLLRILPPHITADYAAAYDASVARCLAALLEQGETLLPPTGVRAAHDTLRVIRTRAPAAAERLLQALQGEAALPSTAAAVAAQGRLRQAGYDAPGWDAQGAGPPAPDVQRPGEDSGPWPFKGWQRLAARACDERAFETHLSELSPASRALLLSQAGPFAARAINVPPTHPDVTIPSAQFRVLLLRRLRMPLPLAPRRCACHGQLDPLGDHRAACATSGVLSTRALPLEHAVARVCRAAGARVARNVRLADMNLDVPVADARRIEVVANGLPLWHGSQLAVDATIVSPLTRQGQAHPRADVQPGSAVDAAARRKRNDTYPELESPRTALSLPPCCLPPLTLVFDCPGTFSASRFHSVAPPAAPAHHGQALAATAVGLRSPGSARACCRGADSSSRGQGFRSLARLGPRVSPQADAKACVARNSPAEDRSPLRSGAMLVERFVRCSAASRRLASASAFSRLPVGCRCASIRGNSSVGTMDLATIVAVIKDTKSLNDVEDAIARGANVNASEDSMPALNMAVQAQHEQLVKLLLRNQARVDASDRKGVTPLHLATFDGSLDTMKTLISARRACVVLAEAGADPNVLNYKGQTPLHLAAHAGLNDVQWLLENMTAKACDLQDKHGRTAVYCAAHSKLKPTILLCLGWFHAIGTRTPECCGKSVSSASKLLDDMAKKALCD